MTAAHPANIQPSLLGHSIGRWEGATLVIDTIGFEPDSSGLALNVPAGARKHMVERLTLTEDRTRLRYEVTVEDPDFLTGPATLTQERDHRPDLDPDAPKQRDITEQVHQHHTKHPGSVRRSDKNKARQAAKRAKASRRGNR